MPAFDRMDLAALKPALEAGMARSLEEIDRIADNPEPATFENTILQMERGGRDLRRVFAYWGIWKSNLSTPGFMKMCELAGKQVNLGGMYVTLDRLKTEDYLSAKDEAGTPSRSGKPRRFNCQEQAGVEALQESIDNAAMISEAFYTTWSKRWKPKRAFVVMWRRRFVHRPAPGPAREFTHAGVRESSIRDPNIKQEDTSMNVLKTFTLAAAVLGAALLAPDLQGQNHEHPGQAQAMMPAGCPMNLDGIEFEIEDIPGGVAVTFQAGAGNLETLRVRVRQAASMLQRMATMMAGEHGHAIEPGAGAQTREHAEEDAIHRMMVGMNMMRWPLIESVTTQDTETGIRIRLVPQGSSDLAELRRQVRDMADHMEAGQCMMMRMMGHMHGPTGAPDTPEADHDEHGGHSQP